MNEYRRVKWLYIGFLVLSALCVLLYLSGFNDKFYIKVYLIGLVDFAFVVLWRNVKLHKLATSNGIEANTFGFKATILSCLLFTPFEAVLVLPGLNLFRLRGVDLP